MLRTERAEPVGPGASCLQAPSFVGDAVPAKVESLDSPLRIAFGTPEFVTEPSFDSGPSSPGGPLKEKNAFG